MVLGAYMAGLDYVSQCMEDPVIRKSLDQTVFDEIVPTVHLPEEKAVAFAKAFMNALKILLSNTHCSRFP